MSSKCDLNFGERILLEISWGFCRLFALLPHYALFYVVAPAVRFLIYRVFKYRVGVVAQNLRNSFPERSDEELQLIEGQFYTYMSEVFVSTIALANCGRAMEVMTNLDPEKESSLAWFKENVERRSCVALSAHFGLWEYEMFWATYSDHPLICVYHPLQSRVADELFKRLRNHYKIITLPSNETHRFVIRCGEKCNEENYTLGLLADQSPPLKPNNQWMTFLNQETSFYDGGEKIALRLGIPVYFIHQRRVTPGRYELCATPLWDGVESVEPNEITSRYAKMLEEKICETPYLWLWSHRRWKRNRSGIEKTKWAKNQKEV